MRFAPPVLSLFLGTLLGTPLAAQPPPPRDPRAVAVLQQSLVAMGGVVPSDSLATGSVVIVAGSRTDSATIRILTRGLDQSAEYIQTPAWSRAVIYSRGSANETQGTSVKRLPLEVVVTCQSGNFPLPVFAGALNNPSAALQYVGLETIGGSSAHHIRFWNTFSFTPRLQKLAEFSVRDVWVDTASGLPRRLSYVRRTASGSVPRIPVEMSFSDYRGVSGVDLPPIFGPVIM